MFKEILYKQQIEKLNILKIFSDKFYLAWWTAIALQLWHRKSIDFDLFSSKEINNNKILNKIKKEGYRVDRILVDNKWEELTLILWWIKVTFLYYPFKIILSKEFEWIKLPDLVQLWAMKFYTLWRRSKWKDYIDIYFLLKNGYQLSEISKMADSIFEWWYNEKLLREQLCYYKDIDYSEEIDYLNFKVKNSDIELFLIKIAKNTF